MPHGSLQSRTSERRGQPVAAYDIAARAGAPTQDNPSLQYLQSMWDEASLVDRRKRASRGDVILHERQPFAGLVLLHSGSCKYSIRGANGHEQITAFRIAGDVMGAEAISGGTHTATATALEDSEYLVVPIERIEAAALPDGAAMRHLCAFLSSEIAHDHSAIMMLGTMRADQRLAAFLLDLASRYGKAGSSREITLRMTREEIGMHLGLTVETVSRLFSRMHGDGLLHVQGRNVSLLDVAALRALAAN